MGDQTADTASKVRRVGLGVLLLLQLTVAVHALLAVWPEVVKIPGTPTAATNLAGAVPTPTASPSAGQIASRRPAARPTATASATATPTPTATPSAARTLGDVRVLRRTWHRPQPDALYLVAVMTLGAIGSSVHALTSFSTYIGNRRFLPSWYWWYLVRVPTGMALALILYFVLRAGLLTVGTSTGDVNPYGMGAVAALAGMFAKQATDKLQETFDTLFRTAGGGDAERKDKLVAGVAVDHVSPASVPVDTTELAIHVYGTGLTEGTKASVGVASRVVTTGGAGECVVRLDPADVAQPGIVRIAIATAEGVVAPVTVRVRPRIDSAVTDTGGSPPTVSLTGAGFDREATVEVDGVGRVIAERSRTALRVELPAQVAGSELQVVVVNPDAAGGRSDPFVVRWPAPAS